MKKLLILTALFIVLVSPSRADNLMRGAHGAAYVGPGDITAFQSWCGLRAFSLATIGAAAINLIRSSDSMNLDINTLADGSLDVATAATFCNATTCVVRTCYDKGTLAHDYIAQGTGLVFVFNCTGSRPCMQSTSGLTGLVSPVHTSLSTVNMTAVFDRASGTGAALYMGNASTGFTEYKGTGANTSKLTGAASGSISATTSDASWHATQAICFTSSSVVRIDATETTGSCTGAVFSGAASINGAASTTVNWGEIGYYETSIWLVATRDALQANQKAYWATP